MRKASDFIDDTGRARVEAAVAEAEKRTAAEIVPVVATASGRYDRAEDIVGLWVGAAAMLATAAVWPERDPDIGTWAFTWAAYEWLALALAVVLGFVAGAVIGARVWWLRALFTPRAEMRDEVAARARQAFYDGRIHRTAGGTGVVFYISLFERMAAVVADDTLTEKIGQATLDAWCSTLTQALRTGPPADALCTAIAQAAPALEQALPRAQDDKNELPNALTLID